MEMFKELTLMNPKSKFIQIALVVLVLWVAISYWLICVVLSTNALKESADKVLKSATIVASNTAASIDIQIKYLKEQPGLIAVLPSVLEVTNKNEDAKLSSSDLEQRKQILNNDTSYHQLSLYFDELEHKLNVNQIYLLDRSGYAVSSSTWSKEGSNIGVNFKDRLSFSRGQSGLSSVQYSMGRTTHTPGLYFSTPIIQKKQFLGLIVVKVDLNNLSEIKSSSNTLLVDSNQVIVAANDQRLNLMALSDSAIKRLNSSQLMGMYLTDQFPIFNIQSWSKDEPTLKRIVDDRSPFIVTSKSLDEYLMDVYVLEPFKEYFEIIHQYRYIFFAVSCIGALVILLLTLFASYILNIRKSNHELWYRANHELLTGLPNQFYLLNFIQKRKSLAQFSSFSLIYIDVDRFREINDRLGHDVGNEIIKEFSTRIRSLLSHQSLLCHLGGDRFAILLHHEVDAEFTKSFCLKIQDFLQSPFRFNDSLILIKSTIVYRLFSSKQDFLNKVLLQVELLVKELRRSKGEWIAECTDEFCEFESKKLELKNSFSEAIDSGQFVPFFQPIINLKTRKIEKAELLIRWNHPKYGLLNPQEFISIAEQSGSILKIGLWCRTQAIQYCKQWVDLLNSPFQISINKSPIELMDAASESGIDHFVQKVHDAGLAGSNFAFEITESILVQEDLTAIHKIDEIVRSGIKLSLDDFGTGFSSLSYLNRFPIDSIKLDISFIANLKAGSTEEIVCNSMIQMAHRLGISVIAEGVETVEQRNILITLGCDYIQGYLYSPPLNAEDFELYLKQNAFADDLN